MAFLTDSDISSIEMPDKFRCTHFPYRAFLIRGIEQFIHQLQVLFPDTPCKEACSPDPGESGRKDVRQEPADEFFCCSGKKK